MIVIFTKKTIDPSQFILLLASQNHHMAYLAYLAYLAFI